MSIQIADDRVGGPTGTEVYVGGITLLFSYSTLVGIAIPGVGRIKSRNRWGSTTGKTLKAWPAKYDELDEPAFEEIADDLDTFFRGQLSYPELIERAQRVLDNL